MNLCFCTERGTPELPLAPGSVTDPSQTLQHWELRFCQCAREGNSGNPSGLCCVAWNNGSLEEEELGREANTWEPCGCDWQGKKQLQHKAKPQQNKQTAGKGSQHSKGTSTERCVKHNSRRKNKPADPELTPNSSLKDSSPPKLCPELPGLFCVCTDTGGAGPAWPAAREPSRARAPRADKCAGSGRAERQQVVPPGWAAALWSIDVN